MLKADNNSNGGYIEPRYNLQTGTKFKQYFRGNSGIEFQIAEINRESGLLKVVAKTPNGQVWEEDWSNEIHILENALDIKEYVLI